MKFSWWNVFIKLKISIVMNVLVLIVLDGMNGMCEVFVVGLYDSVDDSGGVFMLLVIWLLIDDVIVDVLWFCVVLNSFSELIV